MTTDTQPNYADFIKAMKKDGWEYVLWDTFSFKNKIFYFPNGTYINGNSKPTNCGAWNEWQAIGQTPSPF